jgi:dTDP-4-amino-4,6-dideoxygalactose transaminase
MSALSSAIVSAVNLRQVMARRRANFRELLGASRGRVLGRVLEPIYSVLPAGVSPLVFPVRVARGTRDALRRRLHEARVYCPVHWPLPPGVNRSRFPESARLAAQMIGIPLDQRYDASAMKELIDRLTFVCREFA